MITCVLCVRELSVVLSVVGVCGVMEHKETGSVKEELCGRPAFREYNGYCMYGTLSLPVQQHHTSEEVTFCSNP